MAIIHQFVSAISDGADTSVVRPSNWNADHTINGNVDFNSFGITELGSLSGAYTDTSTASALVSNYIVDVTVAPTSNSAAIIPAIIGKATYSGTADITGGGHVVGMIGYSVLNASGRTVALIIGNEGKLDILAGTATAAVAAENQITSNAGTITTGIITDCQLIGNTGTIAILAGQRTAVANGTGTITDLYGTFFQTPTNSGTITNVIANVVQDAAASVVRAFEGQVTSGTNKRNLYMSGTALNYLAATIMIGSNTDSGNGILQITGVAECRSDRGLIFNNQTDAAGANAGTLTNSPTTGNPAWWLKIKVGGTNGAIPVWLG